MLEVNATEIAVPHQLYRGSPFLKGFCAVASKKGDLMLVKQLMSHPVKVCHLFDNLSQVAKLMWEGDCGAVPVVDGAGRAVAMLTDRDICMASYLQGKPLWEIAVRTAMSPGLTACGPDDPVEHAELLMRDYQIRRLPVLDQDGHPVGMLSLNDLARAAVRRHPCASAVGNAGIRLTATARTLAAVCAPRFREGRLTVA